VKAALTYRRPIGVAGIEILDLIAVRFVAMVDVPLSEIEMEL